MQYFYLFLVVIFLSAQSIIQKQYNKKTQDTNAFFFSGIFSLSALMFFVVSSGFKFDFNPDVVIYAVGFGLTYGTAVLTGILALKYGSMGITLLISSYSLLIPTFYGILFLHDPITYMTYIGIAFLAVTLFLLNFKNEKIIFSKKWLICITLSFVGNGMCSTVQKMQQVRFEGAYKSELMIMALFLSAIIFFTVAYIRKEKFSLKKCFPYAVPKGLANGIVNLLVMVLTGTIPNAILFPVISAGGIILGFFASVFIYKERLSKLQYVGYALGVVSIIFLNMK